VLLVAVPLRMPVVAEPMVKALLPLLTCSKRASLRGFCRATTPVLDKLHCISWQSSVE
jgi:hypothetical protein